MLHRKSKTNFGIFQFLIFLYRFLPIIISFIIPFKIFLKILLQKLIPIFRKILQITTLKISDFFQLDLLFEFSISFNLTLTEKGQKIKSLFSKEFFFQIFYINVWWESITSLISFLPHSYILFNTIIIILWIIYANKIEDAAEFKWI